MSIRGRLQQDRLQPHIPDIFRLRWAEDDELGCDINGEFLTWDEIEERYPDAPRRLRWSDETNN